jgi:AbrB family looped-hinge helix DNA binding protein
LESKKVGNEVDRMIIDLRKKSQITIPKEIVAELNLQEGDHLEVSVKGGAIIIEPVAVYSKSYIRKLEDTVMRLNEENIKYNGGPFKSLEDAIGYLDDLDENDINTNEKKK